MKYEIKKKEESFKPFEITLTFETREEYVYFHVHVMSKITRKSSHQFHADVYKAGEGEITEAKGEI